MSNKKSTKRALLTSALSLLMCFSMLVGSTYAWFTDSVAIRNNVITSGNLDVELEYLNADGDWKPVDDTTVLFNETALWEPGYTQAVALKVKNVGSLALKYALSTNIYLEQEGVNVYGNTFKLSDHLVLDAITMDGGAIGDALVSHYLSARDATGLYKNEFGTQIKNDNYVSDSVLTPGTYGYCVLRISMPTTVGNDANHNGTDVPQINFGIELVATQASVESDSFGTDYDEDATYEVLPAAKVETLDQDTAVATLGMGGATTTYNLNKAFRFATTQTKEQAQATEYRYWHADFVVSADKDVAANSMALLGYYEAYCDDYNDGNWVALVNDGTTIAAGDEIRLLELLLDGGSMNYEELCEYVPVFDCGVADLGDNTGTTITVELRLYEVENNAASTSAETGHYVTVGRYTHKF